MKRSVQLTIVPAFLAKLYPCTEQTIFANRYKGQELMSKVQRACYDHEGVPLSTKQCGHDFRKARFPTCMYLFTSFFGLAERARVFLIASAEKCASNIVAEMSIPNTALWRPRTGGVPRYRILQHKSLVQNLLAIPDDATRMFSEHCNTTCPGSVRVPRVVCTENSGSIRMPPLWGRLGCPMIVYGRMRGRGHRGG